MEDLTIGQRIAVKRKELGMSQIDLGEKMGVSRQSISKWESDGALPEIDKLIALSKLFGVSVGWLLGVEHDARTEESPEHEFSDREWEIIDRLSQPRVPKWLVPLTALAAALALLASIVAGVALWDGRKHRAELRELAERIAVPMQQTVLLRDYALLAQPSGDLDECSFLFRGSPELYDPADRAELVIVQGSMELQRLPCDWDGGSYTGQFALPAENGFAAYFELTRADGTRNSTQLRDPLLSALFDARSFGEISVTWDRWSCDGETLTLEELAFVIEAPELLRDTPELWTKCDLVVLAGDRELGRVDMLNRSPYSRDANFGTHLVRFSSRIQQIPLDTDPRSSGLTLVLECELSTGHQIRQNVGAIHF